MMRLAILGLFFSLPSLAQLDNVSLFGTVSDSSSAVIPAAEIKILNAPLVETGSTALGGAMKFLLEGADASRIDFDILVRNEKLNTHLERIDNCNSRCRCSSISTL